MSEPVIAIFDIGKTNKKVFLFDEDYNIVLERSEQFAEIRDEDGDACEDLEKLNSFILGNLQRVTRDYNVRAINFATYGASFVYIDDAGKPVAPLYNYLKPYPETLKKKFYNSYGGETDFAFRTASPVLGSLNSGMQLYRLKYEQPEVFKKIKHALHLPQFASFLVTGKPATDITSIGCHTNLWDFMTNDYHRWVKKEGIDTKLPAIEPSDSVEGVTLGKKQYPVGVGLHDSSAALIPYLVNFKEPFVLISSGTWCISLNPFNHSPLTEDELKSDCLCYLQYTGDPVKASRLFAGHIHDQQVQRLGEHFNKDPEYFKTIGFNAELQDNLSAIQDRFEKEDLNKFASAEEAYHYLIAGLVRQQVKSTHLVLTNSPVKSIFVDGGFGKNPIYMNLLASHFTGHDVYAASVSQATALGAALAIHDTWNSRPFPKDLIKLSPFSTARVPS